MDKRVTKSGGKYQSAKNRWAGLGPYYAMFPSAFADDVIAGHSNVGDTILDPFAGRGTALFSAVSTGRNAIGVELNPVGWVYCKTKLAPAPKDDVVARIAEIDELSTQYACCAEALPAFFQHCYAPKVRSFLMAARSILDWRESDVDRTVMAFILVNLHGKSTDSLSNQMRQTKAMAPQYAIEWWKKHKSTAPNVEPKQFLAKRLDWRYRHGIPSLAKGMVTLDDSTSFLPKLYGNLGKLGFARPSLMLTSPPYFGITNYHYDQWIRLWLLGGPPTDRRVPTQFNGKHQGKFSNVDGYKTLLNTVFSNSAKILRRDAVIYVRTDRREPTASITRSALRDAFPSHRIRRLNQPVIGETQTRLFGYGTSRIGEIDFILTSQ